jgi:deazaflavin-dependent oxidoreductase (nitroreductase family)
MTTQNDRDQRLERNAKVIEEFRSNGGQMSGNFATMPLVLLHTTSAKTGQERTIPLAHMRDGDRVLIFASKGGNPKHPDWYHTILANPNVTVEVGTETFEAEAVVLTGEERDQLFAKQAESQPVFAEYQTRTERQIPVIALNRKS